jgi:hypothetical protein
MDSSGAGTISMGKTSLSLGSAPTNLMDMRNITESIGLPSLLAMTKFNQGNRAPGSFGELGNFFMAPSSSIIIPMRMVFTPTAQQVVLDISRTAAGVGSIAVTAFGYERILEPSEKF